MTHVTYVNPTHEMGLSKEVRNLPQNHQVQLERVQVPEKVEVLEGVIVHETDRVDEARTEVQEQAVARDNMADPQAVANQRYIQDLIGSYDVNKMLSDSAQQYAPEAEPTGPQWDINNYVRGGRWA